MLSDFVSDEQLLSEARTRLHCAGKKRFELWGVGGALTEAVGKLAFLEDNAASVASLVMEAVSRIVDPESRRSVERVLNLSLSNESFFKIFAGALVKHGMHTRGKSESYYILKWTGMLLERLSLPESQKPISKLMMVAGRCLEQLKEKDFLRGTRTIRRMVSRSVGFRDEMLKAASETGSSALLRVVCDVVSSDTSTDPVRSSLIANYSTEILGAKTAPSAASVVAYRSLLATLTRAEFGDVLLPALTRSLRRNPEVVLDLVASLFRVMNLDVGAFGVELQKVLLQFVRHTNSNIQESAVDVLSLVAKLISDRDVVQQMADMFEGILSGKQEGKVKNIHERASLAKSFGVLSSSPSKRNDLSAHVIGILGRLYGTEGNDDVKCELLKSMGCWLKSSDRLVDGAVKAMSNALNGKESLRSAALDALAAGRENGALFSTAVSLVPPLCKIVETGLAKAPSRAEGIAALLILSLISASDPNSDDTISKAGIWSKALSMDSAFFDSAVITKCSSMSCEWLVALCQQLLLFHVTRVDNMEGCLDLVSRGLVLLCLHGTKSVRKAAFHAVSVCLGSSSSLLINFLEGYQLWQRDVPDVAFFAESGGEGDARTSQEEIKTRYRAALAHLLPSEVEADSRLLSRLLVAAHHPIVRSLKETSPFWKALCKSHPEILPALERVLDAVVGELVSESGLKNEDPNVTDAALAAVTTCTRSFPESLFNSLISFLRCHLDKSVADGLTSNEILIFNTPEGTLSTEAQESVIIIQDSKKKHKKKKPKGRYRHEKVAFAEQSESSEEEEEEVPQPKARPVETSKPASKGKKPGHLDAAERQMAFREKQLAEESEVRDRVHTIQKRMELGLRTLTAFISGNAHFAANHIETFAELVMPLLTSDLVGEGAAFEAVRALALTLPEPLNLIPLDVAIVLRLVSLYEKNGSIPYEEIMKHASTLAVMHALAALQIQGGGGAFFLILPILRIALQSSQSPFFESILNVLTTHCVPGEHLPRSEIFSLLYNVLSNSPAVKSLVVEALKNLCMDLIGRELFSVLDGLLFSNPVVRSVALEALFMVPSLTGGLGLSDERVSSLVLLACHDVDEDNSARAQELFDASGAAVTEGQLAILSPLIGHDVGDIRQATVGALVQYLQSHPRNTQKLIDYVIATIKGGCTREWFLGGALMFELCGKLFAAGQTKAALDFLLTEGLTHRDDSVREKMVAAGLSLVDSYDPRDIGTLFELLETKLTEAKGADRNHEADDLMREGAVVLLGSMAKHLSPEDAKVKDIISNLLDVLSTPSEAVQRAASICLSPLVAKCQSDAEYTKEIVTKLKKQVSDGSSYGHRRGAAFGIAGVVKGCGIVSLKNFGIMDTLISYVEDKSNAAAREGGISAFDCLSQRLGKLFEPYVIHILPLLLTCFGDTSLPVRRATAEASKTIMHNLSAQGVKLVLPSLMNGLEDKAWRTKQGSIQLLGAMAWCAPKQLSTCLPTIVPKLITVLADPHPKVHTAAEFALEEVGSTIRNPEVQQLVPDILKAIAYPAQHTVACLDKLLGSRFQNTIDAPSLALVVPVVHHGLKDRTGENKKRAARIVQNICKLVNDPKDMDPYIGVLLPELKKGIVDTLPDVRAQASKALSGLMFDMGKQALEEVMPWLLEMLESKSSAVERSGAAQAVAEVLAVFGEEYFESLLPKILENCSSSSAVLREGGVAVLRYLPYSMPDLFREKLDVVLPYILDGLADENESVRDISLAAGRTLVDTYAQTSLPVILPAVEHSLFHANWRIRQSSVELFGNLIFKVAGTTGKVKLDGDSDDEGPATHSYERNLIRTLGLESRNSVLAKLYMSRSDVQHPVRVAALHIWKTVVMNTPKTLTEILSALMDLIIEMLAFGEGDGRQTSANCLGELVKKMGDRFLPKVIPIMEKCFSSENSETREGVCYGIREVLDSLSSGQMAEYLPVLLPTIQSTLCDEDAAVREAAAGAFDALFKAGASSVVESVIPDLLHKLEDEKETDKALEGLRVILSIRPHTFENMLPKLLKEPINVRRLAAIAALAEVAPGSLRSHLALLMRTLMKLGSRTDETELTITARDSASKIVVAVPEEHLLLLVTELRKGLDDISMRLCAALLISTLATSRSIADHVESLLQALVSLMSEDDPMILKECWNAVKSVAGTVPKEMLPTFIRVLTDAVDTAKEKERRKNPSNDSILVPGFCLPDGIAPILPFYIEGVQGASGELRESSATGLGELVSVVDAVSLKPFVGLIMGPLIRIINDRFPWQIKLAILKTMGALIFKAGDEMRKFVPALQPIFLKCLPDPTEAIRESAAKNLGNLTRLSPRIDPLINNLATLTTKADATTRNAYVSALAEAFVVSGEKISPAVLQKAGGVLHDLLSNLDDNEQNVICLAACLGSYCKHCELQQFADLLKKRLSQSPMIWTQRLFDGVLMSTIAKHCPSRLHEAGVFAIFTDSLSRFVKDDSVPVKKASCRAAARLLMSECKQEALAASVPVVCTCLSPDQSTELHEEALKSLQFICIKDPSLLKDHLGDVVPLLCAMARESIASKKISCETALCLALDLSDGFITAQAFLADSPGAGAKSLLVDPYLRRIQRFTKLTEHEEETY